MVNWLQQECHENSTGKNSLFKNCAMTTQYLHAVEWSLVSTSYVTKLNWSNSSLLKPKLKFLEENTVSYTWHPKTSNKWKKGIINWISSKLKTSTFLVELIHKSPYMQRISEVAAYTGYQLVVTLDHGGTPKDKVLCTQIKPYES